MQMRLAHVVVGADIAALEDREEVLGGVGVIEATDILIVRVNDAAMGGELTPDIAVKGEVVGHEVRRAIDVREEQRTKVAKPDVGNMKRAGATVALD